MQISGTTAAAYALSQVSQARSASATKRVDGDGDNDGTRVRGSRGGAGGGKFIDAIFQALSQIAGPSTSGSATTGSTGASTSPPSSVLQSLGSFVHDLFAALQSQGGQSAAAPGTPQGGQSVADSNGTSTSTGGDSTVEAPAHHRHHGHGGGVAQVEARLQGLIQALASSNASPTGTQPADAGSAAGGPSTDALSKLQQSYQTLLGALGESGSASSLGNFLQALSKNLQGFGSTGSVVQTKA
jgi:hypothetical protein